MCRRAFIYKSQAFIPLFIGLFILSGCGQSETIMSDSGHFVTETVQDCVKEELPKTIEVPLNIEAEEILYYDEDDIEPLRALHRCVSDGKNIYFTYGEPDLYVMPIGTEEHSRANIENPEGMDKGPDMINFGGQYSPLDASSGMMADLSPFIEKDESFEKIDFYFNILESFEVGDSLYVLVPNYRIDSYTTVNKGLSSLERMDIRQLIDAYNMLDADSILFPGETKKAVFGMLCYGSLENYVDWDEGISYFNSDSFKEILHFANQFPLNLNMANDYSAKEIFAEGRALLYPVSIDNVYGTAGIRTLYGETPAYIGYPFDTGNGNMAAIVDIAIGINSTSKNKEEAWGFLRSLLDREFQDNTEKGLPLRVSSLEQKLEDAKKEEFNSNGEKVIKEQLNFDGEDPVNVYEISNEDAETLKAIIHNIEYGMVVDSALYSIILEEADYLFYDNRHVDDVVNIIQNRASVYINEKK